MGPLNAKFVSQLRMSAARSVKPKLWSSASMFDPCDHLPAMLPKYEPAKLLPPVFGIMLKAGPPRSTSASPPAIVTCTSDAFDMSYWYPDTPPPPTDEPTFMPSIWMLPSLLRPPCELKKLFDG